MIKAIKVQFIQILDKWEGRENLQSLPVLLQPRVCHRRLRAGVQGRAEAWSRHRSRGWWGCRPRLSPRHRGQPRPRGSSPMCLSYKHKPRQESGPGQRRRCVQNQVGDNIYIEWARFFTRFTVWLFSINKPLCSCRVDLYSNPMRIIRWRENRIRLQSKILI